MHRNASELAVARRFVSGVFKGIPAELTALIARLHASLNYIPEHSLLVKHSPAAGPAIRPARGGCGGEAAGHRFANPARQFLN
jgi:hypothetical protein